MQLVKYQLSDGAIVGGWSANMEELLLPNIVADDTVYGYLLSGLDLSMRELEQDYHVVDGVLLPKAR